MNVNRDGNERRRTNCVQMLAGVALTLTLLAGSAVAQTQVADVKPVDVKPAEAKGGPESYQTIYLTNITQSNDANDIQTALRNMLPRAKMYYLPSTGALSIRTNAEDMLLAQKMISELDLPKKSYRLTYTITETDGGKRIGAQHFTLIAVSGGRTTLKQGSKVPIVTGFADAGSTAQNSQVTYIDVGLSIEASLEGNPDAVRLHTKVEQSSSAEEKPSVGVRDPVIRQSSLEGTSILMQGKPLVLGSLDVPGGTRHLDVEVVSELVP